jgi:hypothetical protein
MIMPALSIAVGSMGGIIHVEMKCGADNKQSEKITKN